MKNNNTIAFTKKNYFIILAGLACVILGFMLMSGGGSPDPKVWNDDVFSFRRITLAPIVVIGGYVIVVIGIMKKNKPTATNDIEKIDLGDN